MFAMEVGGGGGMFAMVLFPPGEVLLWDFFRGRFFIWYNFRGDNLPWYFFPYHEICVGGGRFTIDGGSFTIWYCFPPGEVLPWDLFRGKVCHMVFLQGESLLYGIISGGGGGGVRGNNSHVTPGCHRIRLILT